MRKIKLGTALIAGGALLAGGLAAFMGAATHRNCPTGDLRAEYFANPNLEGEPVVTRCEPYIDVDWQFGPPRTQGSEAGEATGSDQGNNLPEDNFSVRWRGDIEFAEGSYVLTAGSDDGMRVWVDDQLVIDRWGISPYAEQTAELHLSGGVHAVRVEYYEDIGTAAARVAWAPAK
jgi:PA14 domain